MDEPSGNDKNTPVAGLPSRPSLLFESDMLKPDAVDQRMKKRAAREYEEASKNLIKLAQVCKGAGWSPAAVADIGNAALLLAEVYVAKREGIIKRA